MADRDEASADQALRLIRWAVALGRNALGRPAFREFLRRLLTDEAEAWRAELEELDQGEAWPP